MNIVAQHRSERSIATTQSLFDADPPGPPAGPLSGLFADIVFDRPLDHAFTYSVPEALAGAIGVGKRVEAPFGRGGKATIGFCVRVTAEPPDRASRSSRSRACSTRTRSSTIT